MKRGQKIQAADLIDQGWHYTGFRLPNQFEVWKREDKTMIWNRKTQIVVSLDK